MIRLITEAQPVSAAVHCSSEQRLWQPRSGLRDGGCVWFEEHSAHAERLLYKSWNKDPEPFHHVMGNNTLLAATWQWLKKNKAQMLCFYYSSFLLFFFFLTPHLGWQQHTLTIALAVHNELVYSAALSLSSRCVECVWRAGTHSEQPLEITAAQGALPGFPQQLLVQRESCLEKLVQQGLLCPSGKWGERIFCEQTEELGSCFCRARNTPQGISFSRGAVQFLGVWLGGWIPLEHTHHMLLKKFH